jgi:hypothetical protein
MKPLTKSRFKLGLECPNKLYYTNKKEYANQKNEDTFLQALAQGGFQVEELARMHYPDGVFINTENGAYDEAVQLTANALEQENVIIYEAAFLFDGLFIRTDILVKKGNAIQLIEVKAKAFDPQNANFFVGVRGALSSDKKPYLFDLAFQKNVAANAYPHFHFSAHFMMADKTKMASVNGLNQMFRVPSNGNPRTDIIKKVSTLAATGNPVLSVINVDALINDIINNKHPYYENLNFQEAIPLLKNSYQNNVYSNWPTDFSKCKKCEFKASIEDKKAGKLSGFEYCFKKQHNWSDDNFLKPNAMEVWRFRGKDLLESNRLFMEDLTEEDFKIEVLADKISSGERQWLQVEKSRNSDESIYVEKEGLKTEMAKWKFPLHFIDFETSTVALPFTAGRRPYEQVAFQFSHHIYYEDGTIEHNSEFISNTPGEFPNFIFARALQNTLSKDEGTIFRFAAHENTILNAIIDQLKNSDEVDSEKLIAFLKTITNAKKDSVEKWEGARNMVDLNKIVIEYYYNPFTKGSNSIKAVLPAALKSSAYLKQKYSQPIGAINLTCTNFADSHIWLKSENGAIVNPYKILPPVFEGWSELELIENVSDMDGIADGGAALTAYAKLQYEDMTDKERAKITTGLLKYCELDTLAMVMIYEHFREDLIA